MESTHPQADVRDRGYLIVEAGEGMIDSVGIERDRDMIWQASAAGYDEMRAEHPHGDLPLFLQGKSAEVAKSMQERARKTEAWETWLETVMDWMDEEHTLQSFMASNGYDLEDSLDETHMGVDLETMVCRIAVNQKQAIGEALGLHGNAPSGTQPDQLWKRVLAELQGQGWTGHRCRIGGERARWLIRPDATEDERMSGFRICCPAQAPRIAQHIVDDDLEIDGLI
jgi:hypothetical protein